MDNYYTVDWFSHNILNIQTHITSKFKAGLEIGCHEGRSACYWLRNIITDDGSLTCIDPWETDYVFQLFNHNITVANNELNKKLNVIKDYSNNVLPTFDNNIFDFIYIDGDHTANNVYNDLILSYRVCKPNGIILCDDYLLHEVFPNLYSDIENDYPYKGINKFIEEYKNKIEIIFSDYQILLRKIC